MVLHISAECFPAAKAGGLADVVGALPKYLIEEGMPSAVIMPKYSTKWILGQEWETVYEGQVWIAYQVPFRIQKQTVDSLGFTLFVVDIPGKFDRDGIYKNSLDQMYMDGPERFTCFQRAVLQWMEAIAEKPSIVHCHDNHTGLIPFLMKFGLDFPSLKQIPTLFTIHNGQYHGAFGWGKFNLIPPFDPGVGGLLEWNNQINPLACGIKCSWKLSTVSPTYMRELQADSNGLEVLLQKEKFKSLGILNGIDAEIWDPKTDPMLIYNLKNSIAQFKKKSKEHICKMFGLDTNYPLISFIGRFVYEKASDLLPEVVYQSISRGLDVNLFMLGSGDPAVQMSFDQMKPIFQGRFNDFIGYNEELAHQLYAASDFLLMPSRVEPCGLNQFYAMRYGTIPLVRRTGGLNDSVIDIGDPDGRGIMFNHASSADILHALWRASNLYKDAEALKNLRSHIMNLDFSWNHSAKEYIKVYDELFV